MPAVFISERGARAAAQGLGFKRFELRRRRTVNADKSASQGWLVALFAKHGRFIGYLTEEMV